MAGGQQSEKLKQTKLWDLKSWVISKVFNSSKSTLGVSKAEHSKLRYPPSCQPHSNPVLVASLLDFAIQEPSYKASNYLWDSNPQGMYLPLKIYILPYIESMLIVTL